MKITMVGILWIAGRGFESRSITIHVDGDSLKLAGWNGLVAIPQFRTPPQRARLRDKRPAVPHHHAPTLETIPAFSLGSI